MVEGRLAHAAVSSEPYDTAQWWTVLSALGLAAATLLALIGGSPVDLPMPTHLIGLVTPTCGLTRGSTALVRGDYSLAWSYNPVSFAVVGFGVVGAFRAVLGLAAGRWFGVSVAVRPLGCAGLFAAVVLLWVNQQHNAEFIMTSRA